MRLMRCAALLLGLPLIAGGAQNARRVAGLPGFGYTLRVVGAPGSGGALIAGSAADAQNYVGRSVVAASRGRMDILSGGIESLFAKGDYLLFDSTDVVVVHPATKEFVPISREAA